VPDVLSGDLYHSEGYEEMTQETSVKMTREEALARARKLFGKEARAIIGKRNSRNSAPPDPADVTDTIFFVGKANQEGRIGVIFGKGATWEEAVSEAEIAVAGACGDKNQVIYLKHSY
jgi:hypothetical protein